MRKGRLLVEVRALSGATYPEGTRVRLGGGGAAVDAWIGGDWVPLSWWEFVEDGPELDAQSGGGEDR